MVEPFFIECVSVDDANRVDMSKYRLEKFSESRGYVFVRRKGK